MQKASKELIKDKMCLKEDPGRLGWSHCFDPPCKGVGEPSQPGPASPGPAPAVPGRFPKDPVRGRGSAARGGGDGRSEKRAWP